MKERIISKSVIKGDIEFDGKLIFKISCRVEGFIKAKRIEAKFFLSAGEGIKAGKGIEAGTGIKAGWGIEAGTE